MIFIFRISFNLKKIKLVSPNFVGFSLSKEKVFFLSSPQKKHYWFSNQKNTFQYISHFLIKNQFFNLIRRRVKKRKKNKKRKRKIKREEKKKREEKRKKRKREKQKKNTDKEENREKTEEVKMKKGEEEEDGRDEERDKERKKRKEKRRCLKSKWMERKR
jgi:hypothetical protein